MSLNPLDDLGKVAVCCHYCGAENMIYVSYAAGGSDECWNCCRVIHWHRKGKKIFIDQYTDGGGNVVEKS